MAEGFLSLIGKYCLSRKASHPHPRVDGLRAFRESTAGRKSAAWGGGGRLWLLEKVGCQRGEANSDKEGQRGSGRTDLDSDPKVGPPWDSKLQKDPKDE